MKHETLLSRVLANPSGGEALAKALSGTGSAPDFSGHWVNSCIADGFDHSRNLV